MSLPTLWSLKICFHNQDGQDEAQDGQDEAQDGQDEAQDGQDVHTSSLPHASSTLTNLANKEGGR